MEEIYHFILYQDLEENIHQSDPRDLDNTIITLLIVFPPPIPLIIIPDNLSVYTLDIHYRYYIRFLIGDQ
jgi:hypothetical protein